MTVIAATSPLILLSKINAIELLYQFYGEIWITPEVRGELNTNGPFAMPK